VQTRSFDVDKALHEAISLQRAGQLRAAEKIYGRVLKLSPGNFDALHLLGSIRAQTGQIGEAYRLFASALTVNPHVAEVWSNYANVLRALKRNEEALDAMRRALALRPGDADLMQQQGHSLLSLGRPAEALVCFDTALATRPAGPDALNGRGLALAAIGRHEDALSMFDAALAKAPQRADLLYNRGNVLLECGRAADALTAYDHVLARSPDHAKAWNNRGRALQDMNRRADAVSCFDKAISLDRNDAAAHFNLSLALLGLGNFDRGLREYEWRWKRPGMPARKSPKPLWLGDFSPAGRTLLLQAEQGLGDTIQFARYVPLVAQLGAKIRLEVQPELMPLLEHMPGILSCHARGAPLPDFDLVCPMGSLPLAMKTTATTIPAGIPYLAADNTRLARWRQRIAALPGKRIAIAWAGNPQHVNDRNRSLPLSRLADLFGVAGATFIAAQRDLRDDDAAVLARFPNVLALGADLADMAETAAVLTLADLTIAVDTSIVHLAGAMGRPTWIMLPFAADWRWGNEDANAWYPQARLYRQPVPRDWTDVIAQVRDALLRFVRG
jgi:tetratricopeptide (TPR) repeat protein